ncbi:hypothetical protein GGQ97_001145 [Sphingomonas kaistensis]|uniref:Ice-binding protein C-terminal domain-containing protein n=1 Tax=Sphingomonas kaistensis TaxID=298708 RepID=A0A7X5Y597_9SPHN|nr:choice-of-anchor L domain-containing protein [Sphingomonas kaistensis]NJC05352.1 hypothetical protein [Sphingomonas kaistensis]
MGKFTWVAAAALMASAAPAMAVDTVLNNNGTQLGSALTGTGITVNSSSLTTNTQNGTFTNGTAGVGISQGVVLTTGSLGCVGSANTTSQCSGDGDSSNLTLNFTTTSDSLFFNYVFASEEYNEFVGTNFNDFFQLLLNGPGFNNVNLAQVPGGGGAVTINNVNLGSNAGFFRNNEGGALPVGYDGLTTVLTASALGLTAGANYSLSFIIQDVGDSSYDSAVFIGGGSVGTVQTPIGAVPEPSTWAMMLLGFGAIGASMRRRRSVNAVARLA